MADYVLGQAQSLPENMRTRYRDMGDTTHALVVSTGAGALSIGKEEDTAHASGDTGVFILGVRNDADAVMTDVDLDYGPVAVTDTARAKTVATVQVGVNDASASNPVPVTSVPGASNAVLQAGITELIGKDERVDQNEYSASVGVALGGSYSGEISQFTFYSTEEDAGAVQRPTGKLIIFDADPATTAGDSALAAAEWKTAIGKVHLSEGDWTTDANGGAATILDQPIAFHAVANLYLVFLLESATSINDGATDDEVIEIDLWYTRNS